MFAEVRLRSGTNWGTYTILRNVSGLTFDTKYLDIGAITFDMLTSDAKAVGLTDQSVIEIAPNGVSQPNMWYGIDGTSGTKTADGAQWTTFSGKSIASWLTDGLVYPSTWPDVPVRNPDGTLSTVIQGHSFYLASPGTILRTLIARCKERFSTLIATNYYTLNWLDETSFTGTTTTSGSAWTTTLSTTYQNGTTLLQVLQDLSDRRLIEFRMNGMQLQVYNFGTNIVHYTPEQVTFRRGQNVIEQNTNTDSSTSASTVLVQGDNAAIQEISDTSLLTSIGRRRERYVTQGGIIDGPTLALLGTAELSITGHIQTEETLGVTDSQILPWINYKPGDWVWEDVDGTLKNLQIMQISASSTDANNLTIGLTLGDLISEQDAILQRKIDNITGQDAGSYGGLPNTIQDFLAPSPPTLVVASPTAYRDSNGNDHAQVTITWAIPTTNTDGSQLTDMAYYDVQYRISSDPNWITFPNTSIPWSTSNGVPANSTLISAFISNLPPGQSFISQVRAIDTDGNASAWAPQTNTITALPHVTTAPPTPSTPVTSGAFFKGIIITWDGKDNTAADYDSSWARTDVHMSTSSSFTPSAATRMGAITAHGGSLPVGGLDPTLTYYAKLIAWDKSGNSSATSVVSNGSSPTLLSDPDIANKLITGAKIADGTINTTHLTVATFGDSIVPNPGFEDGPSAAGETIAAKWRSQALTGTGAVARDTTHQATGAACAAITTPPTSSAQLVSANSDGTVAAYPTAPNDVWYVTGRIRGSRAFTSTTTALQACVFVTYSDATTQEFQTFNMTNMTLAYQTLEGQFVIPGPSGVVVATKMTFYIKAVTPSDNLSMTYYIDDLQLRPVGGSAAIKDLSVVNAKINSVSADKITVGSLFADMTVSARIKTADTGARVEMNSTGLFIYDAAGNPTLQGLDTDGSVTISGTLSVPFVPAGWTPFVSFGTAYKGNTAISRDGVSQSVSGILNRCTNTAPGFFTVNEGRYIFLDTRYTGGTLTFTFNGVTSGAVNVSGISAATIQTALQAMSSIGAGNATVANFFFTGSYRVEFTGTLGGQHIPHALEVNVGSATPTIVGSNNTSARAGNAGRALPTAAGSSTVRGDSAPWASWFSPLYHYRPRYNVSGVCGFNATTPSTFNIPVAVAGPSNSRAGAGQDQMDNNLKAGNTYVLSFHITYSAIVNPGFGNTPNNGSISSQGTPTTNPYMDVSKLKLILSTSGVIKTGIDGVIDNVFYPPGSTGFAQRAPIMYRLATPQTTGLIDVATLYGFGGTASVQTDTASYKRFYMVFTVPSGAAFQEELQIQFPTPVILAGTADPNNGFFINAVQIEDARANDATPSRYVDYTVHDSQLVQGGFVTSNRMLHGDLVNEGFNENGGVTASTGSFGIASPLFADPVLGGSTTAQQLEVLNDLLVDGNSKVVGNLTVEGLTSSGWLSPYRYVGKTGVAGALDGSGVQNFWTAFDPFDSPSPRFAMDRFGFVRLSGVISAGSIGTLFTLPSRYRPAWKEVFMVAASADRFARIDVFPNGDVVLIAYAASGTNAYLGLDGISFYTGPESDWHSIGGAGEPAFTNGWSNYGSGYAPAGYLLDDAGYVHMRGLVAGGSFGTSGTPVAAFTLPFAPDQRLIYCSPAFPGGAGQGLCRIDLLSTGLVGFLTLQSSLNTYVSVSGKSFYVNSPTLSNRGTTNNEYSTATPASFSVAGGSWVDYDGGAAYAIPRFHKDDYGLVHLSGLAKSGTALSNMLVLPRGYAPNGTCTFTAQAALGTARINVYDSGAISVQGYSTGGSNANVSLEDIVFFAEAG